MSLNINSLFFVFLAVIIIAGFGITVVYYRLEKRVRELERKNRK